MPTPRRRTARKRNGRTAYDRQIDAQRALDPRDYPTITKAEADRIRRAYEANEAARKVFDPKRYQRGGGYSPADVQKIADLAGVASPSNAERGALELYEFMHDPPTVKFLYVTENKNGYDPHKAQTFAGDYLGRVYFGQRYRAAGFGGRSAATERVPITLYAVNGKRYVGTYFSGAGNYARVRLAKG